MTFKRILDHNPETGVTEIFYGSADGESYTIETVQAFDPIERRLKEIKANSELNRKSDMWHVGTIPLTVVQELLKQGIDVFNPDHKRAVARFLNDSDNQLFNRHDVKI